MLELKKTQWRGVNRLDSKYKITYTRAENPAQSNEKKTYRESAASVSEVDTYQYGKTSSINHREKKRWWTKFFLTVMSAILIGLLFGLFLLQIFSQNQDHDQAVSQDSELEPIAEEPGQVEPTPDEGNGQSVEVGPLSGYVIQAGAFQDFEQANLAQEFFLEEGYQSVIWEAEDDYRVFLAIYSSIDVAKQIGEQFTEAGYDVYARDWQSKQGTVAATNGEWLTQFQELWQQSLTNHSETVEQAWEQWIDIEQEQLPVELETFHQKISPIVAQFDEEQLPFILLELLHAYDQLIE